MSKRAKDYQSKEKEGDNASKGGKGRGPPVDGPPVDGPPVDGTQAGTTQTESSLSTMTVQPSDDPTGSIGDLANDIDPADNMPIHSDQNPGQSLHDASVKDSGSTVQGASAGGNMSGNGTRPKTSRPVPSTNVEEYGISHTEQEAAAGGQMPANGTRPNEEAARRSNENRRTGPVPSAGFGTSGESPKLDLQKFKQYLNKGFLVISMDHVTELLIKMLAESISSKPEWKELLTELIENWQSPPQAIQTQEETNLQRATKRVIEVPYASLWSDVWAMANGTKDVVYGPTSNIFLDVFGLTFRNMLDSDQQSELDVSLRQAITEADQTEIHSIPKVRAQNALIVEYLKREENYRLAFRQVLIEQIIRTTKLYLGELNSSVQTFLPLHNKEIPPPPIDESNALSKKRRRFDLVQSMIKIRNDVVHRKSGFVDKEREHFEDDYEAFIKDINLLTYCPTSTHAAQRERYLEPIRDVKRFHEVGEEHVRLTDDLQKKSKESSDRYDEVRRLNGVIENRDTEIGKLLQESDQLKINAARQAKIIQSLRKRIEELEGKKK